MFKEVLKGRLAHSAIPRKGFIDLPFHYPFSEPNELIFSFYTNVFNGKICLTISTLKALFSISFSFFDDVIRTTNWTFFIRFGHKIRVIMKPLSL